MRGDDQQLQSGMFSYVALEDRIPAYHPLRDVVGATPPRRSFSARAFVLCSKVHATAILKLSGAGEMYSVEPAGMSDSCLTLSSASGQRPIKTTSISAVESKLRDF
jgi:hypothetical protein